MLKPVIIHFREKPERLKMLKTKMKFQKIKKRKTETCWKRKSNFRKQKTERLNIL